jgi:hypothetical protein
MSQRSLPAWSSVFTDRTLKLGWGVTLAALLLANVQSSAATKDVPEGIELDLSPRVCTLSASAKNCDTAVTARWRAAHDESLCLLIVGQPQVRQCWEHHSAGVYTVRVVFNTDLLVELRDLQLQQVLASETIAVIREALHLRRKRRQPWDILP